MTDEYKTLAIRVGDVDALPFTIVNEPFCAWCADMAQVNERVLGGMDASYFAYLVDTHERELENPESEQHAAIAIRSTYSQALEAFFALLGATIQAPDFVLGWLLKYRPAHLTQLLGRLEEGAPLPTRIFADTPDWEDLSRMINATPQEGATADDLRTHAGFATAWRLMAKDYRDDHRRHEYNSIKHGLRITAGGFHVAIAPQKRPGESPAPGGFESLGGGNFGSLFYEPTEMHVDAKWNYQIRQHALNWDPGHLARRVRILSWSMQNIIYVLEARAKKTSERRLLRPDDLSIFDDPEGPGLGVMKMSGFLPTVVPESVTPVSKEDIRLYADPHRTIEPSTVRETGAGQEREPSEAPADRRDEVESS
jgi:hypothetical protein